MTRGWVSYFILCVAIILLVGIAITKPWRDAKANALAQAQQEDKAVEAVNKNIQVLKGMPSSQLLLVMHFMRTSLGVRCDYCHVAENGKYWMDDKPAKATARRMLQMVAEINKANFGGQPVVTCNTCHRGSTQPVPVPAIGQGAFVDTTRAEEAAPAPLPSVDEVLDHYIKALGGREAVDKIKTKTTTATILRPKLVNSGTSKAAMLNRGETLTFETFLKTPDKYAIIIHALNQTTVQGINGDAGWSKTGSEQRLLSANEVTRLKRQADLYKDLKLREQYSKMRVKGLEKLGEREVFVLEGQNLSNKTEKLCFDVKSGLLLRRVSYTSLWLGQDPEQTDYEDYREVDGVRLPFVLRTSYLDDNHYGTTRTLNAVKQNVPIDESRFEVPAIPK